MVNDVLTTFETKHPNTPVTNYYNTDLGVINSPAYILEFFEEMNFQKVGNSTYERVYEFVSEIINQLKNVDLQQFSNNKYIDYILELINQLIQSSTRSARPMLTENNDILSISEDNAVSYLENHEYLIESLYLYVNKIKGYLRDLGKYDDVGLMLQGSPEIQDFNVIVIYIKTEFSGVDEKLDLYDDIGDILNEVTNEIAADKGEEMYNKLENVTYLIGEVND